MAFKKLTAAALLGATLFGTVAPAAAEARNWRHDRYEQRYDRRDYDRRHYRSDYRQGCKRSSTTGLLLGGVAGALLGRAVDTRGERTTGTVLGAGAGALLGNEVGKNC